MSKREIIVQPIHVETRQSGDILAIDDQKITQAIQDRADIFTENGIRLYG